MTATEAQVAAAMEALGCAPSGTSPNGFDTPICMTHSGYWTERGCPVAVTVADAVVAAGPDPAKVAAEALAWRDRGQIIHDQQARIAQLERECLDREATETDARSQLATTQTNCTCRSAT